MKYKTGILTYTDARQVQDTVVTDDFGSFFNEKRIIQHGKIRETLTNIFVNGSMNRSFFFMDFNIREYASYATKSNWLPVFGVKGGSPGLTRKTNYAEIHLCSEEELAGESFNESVFGTEYLTGEETVSLTPDKLISRMWRSRSLPKCSIAERNRKAICRTLEKLWETQEKDPRTRFIIKLDDAEGKSPELLQQLYLLMPQRLRLQLGFETNINSRDLNQIQDYGGIPIYIMTAERSQTFDLTEYSFPVVIYDFDAAEKYSYNEHRIQLIERLTEKLDERMLSNLDYSERKVLEEKGALASSFKYYEDIIGRLSAGELFWWNRNSVESIDELERIYHEQNELMQNPDYRNEALTAYYMTIYPNSNLAQQTVDLYLQNQSEKRNRQLSFLANNLNQKKSIDAIGNMFARLESQRKQSENSLRIEMQAENDRLLKEKNEQRNQFGVKIANLSNQIKQLEEEKASLNQKFTSLMQSQQNKQSESANSQKGDSDEENNKQKVRELSKRVRQAKKQLLLFKVFTAMAVIAAVVFLTMFIMNTRKLGTLQNQNASIEREVEELKNQIDTLSKDKAGLEKELQSMKEAADASNTTEEAGDTGEAGGEDLSNQQQNEEVYPETSSSISETEVEQETYDGYDYDE